MDIQVYAIDGVTPVVDRTAFVHPTAVLIGDVVVGPHCYVGPGASLRGDMGRVVVEEGSNVQDRCILHCLPGQGVTVSRNGHVSHGSVLHGCTLAEGVLVGVGAVIMDDVHVGEGSIVGAMAYVMPGTEVPPHSVVMGVPGKVVRTVREAEQEWKRHATESYQQLTQRSRQTMRLTVPLKAVEAQRGRIMPPQAEAPSGESPRATRRSGK